MKFFNKYEVSRKGITVCRLGTITTYNWFYFLNGRYTVDGLCQSLFPNSLPSPKLLGFEYPEIVSEWVRFKYPLEHVIVLLNINVQAKNIQFWAKVPQTDIKYFLKDTVILRCKDKSEVQRLVENIPPDFAEAYGYSAGALMILNGEN